VEHGVAFLRVNQSGSFTYNIEWQFYV